MPTALSSARHQSSGFGEIPIEVTVSPSAVPREEPQIFVRADLSGAELVLDTIAWRKPPGSAADVQFEIIRNKGRSDLNEFRLRGENIAADGFIVIGPDNRLREFSFRASHSIWSARSR